VGRTARGVLPGAAAMDGRFAQRAPGAQKSMERRPIMRIRHEIAAFVWSALLAAQAVACAAGDVDLGERGGAGGHAGNALPPAATAAGVSAGAAGTGVRTNLAGQGGAVAGTSGQASGSAGTSGMRTAGSMAPMTGSGGAASMTGAGGSGVAPQPTPGCGMEPLPADTSIVVSGMTGTYILDLPRGYDKNRPYPLVMSFRGANVTADAFHGYLNLQPLVAADAILVTPNCLGDAPAWDAQRDLPLFDALLAHLESSYCVDQRRIFLAGHTSGGLFTNAVGCMRGDKLRGIAPLSTGPPPVGTCQGEFAVWMSQGNADMTVTPAMGRADRDFWARRNKCDATRPMPVDPAPCVEYAGCDVGFAVRYCEYDGDLGLPAFAAAGIWDFFKGL
jgi:polyhydroxybutyrate depolymerase